VDRRDGSSFCSSLLGRNVCSICSAIPKKHNLRHPQQHRHFLCIYCQTSEIAVADYWAAVQAFAGMCLCFFPVIFLSATDNLLASFVPPYVSYFFLLPFFSPLLLLPLEQLCCICRFPETLVYLATA